MAIDLKIGGEAFDRFQGARAAALKRLGGEKNIESAAIASKAPDGLEALLKRKREQLGMIDKTVSADRPPAVAAGHKTSNIPSPLPLSAVSMPLPYAKAGGKVGNEPQKGGLGRVIDLVA